MTYQTTLSLSDYQDPMSRIIRALYAAISPEDRDTFRLDQTESIFTQLLEQYSGIISRICYSFAGCAQDYEDLYQDVLINIWKGIPAYRGDSSIKTWVYRITMNSCVSVFRKQKKRKQMFDSRENIPDIGEDTTAQRENVEWLHQLLSTLRPDDRSIIMMWLDDLPYNEIADVMGLSRNNVATRIHRIKTRLSENIDKI